MWPTRLVEGDIVLRPLAKSDARAYKEVTTRNQGWLGPWEATSPDPGFQKPAFRELLKILNRQGKRGQAFPFVIEVEGQLRGQLTLSSVQWGSLRTATIGYWIDRAVAGQGIVPTAVAMAVDFGFFSLGLHRIQIDIRPENAASLRVVEKLGFRDEGLREAYMHIDGEWADHRSFALVVEDLPGGLLPYWRQVRQES